ncbi:hypothetical protein [Maribellus mangrovi]|uniref:hypothetical protein n=1 Tax=Maribellus mangrovi TaxID=3133146 RepID=UPI0030ECBAC9
MKNISLIIFMCVIVNVHAQNSLQIFDGLIGKWEGTGTGFGNAQSEVSANYNWLMNRQYIEVKHHSEFDPTDQNPEGEIHDDQGIISFDKARQVVVFRQYHNEGFFNEYVLNDSLSTKSNLIFETERIENFVPGGRAKFTIKLIGKDEIQTVFDVGFPGREMACFGTNNLKRVE